MSPAAITFNDGQSVRHIAQSQFDSIRNNIAELDIARRATAFFEEFSSNDKTVWTPTTCKEIQEFLLDARSAASERLSALKVWELEGDDYDCRQHLIELRNLAQLVEQLLIVIRMLAHCIVNQTSLCIQLIEAG